MKTEMQQIQLEEQKQPEPVQKISDYLKGEKLRDEVKGFGFFLTLFSAAVAGRVALQFVPSVEPIIPLAVIAGLIWGSREGFALGSGAYVASNFFVWGLQGPWTFFQAIGAGVPGLAAGLYGGFRKNASTKELIFLSVLGTVFFEIVMNVSGSLMGIGLAAGLIGIPLYFITSAPFSAVHILSNMVFAKAFSPLLKFRRNKNGFSVIAVKRVAAGSQLDVRLYKSDN